MTFLRSHRNLSLATVAACVGLALSAASASAQQVTYYNFNTPATASPSQYSYSCAPNSASNPLFCFNYSGAYQNPSFIQDPPATGPYAAQLTYSDVSQAASMWFSVPQNVVNGFNVWFEFKMTPSSNSYSTGDGLAFVIQNALSGGSNATAGCTATGQGPTALGSGGGCIGYGGIPNSVALEFDTYNDQPYDPNDYGVGTNPDNHIALQSCGLSGGSPLANSPAHIGTGNCLISLGGPNNTSVSTLISNPNSSAVTPTPVTLADGQVHQVVMVYNGPLDTPANTLSVYLDPQYNSGTLTPVDGSVPIFTGHFDLTQYLNLATDSGLGPAYVGFTAATGAAFEQHELMAWTFTPHTTVSQQQPLNPPGTPTTFDFGTHSYTTNFPQGTNTNDITMGVIANTITPDQFSALLGQGPAQYTGSKCQVYDDTGGKCIIYSVYCYFTSTGTPTACPAPTTAPIDCADKSASDCIDLTSSYNNSVQPASPGYLQGDPLFSPVSSISTSGTTATVTCLGECAVTANQVITILDASDNPVASNVTVQSVQAVNQFTFTTSSAINQSGGFLTSNNAQDIFISYSPQNIDGSTTGHAKTFSDFVVTSATTIGSSMQVAGANNNTATVNTPEQITATVTIPATVPENGLPNNLLTLLPTGSPGLTVGGTVSFFEGASTTAIAGCDSLPLTLNNSAYTATCSYTPGSTGPVTITAQYSGDGYHQGSSNSAALTVNAASTVSISPSSIDFGTLYLGNIVTRTVKIQNVGTTALSITDPRIAIVGGGDSKEFITLNLCPRSLPAGRSCLMTVTFIAGPFYTQQTAVLTINDSSPDSPQTVPLTATVINPWVRLSTGRLNFGTHKVGTSTTGPLTVTNIGATDLSITSIGVTGADPLDFTVPNTCPATLTAGNSCTLMVTFTPQAKRGRSAVLVITDNARNSPQSVSLSGTGN